MEACQAALDFATNEGECRLYGTQEADMKLYQTELGNNDKWLPYVPGKEVMISLRIENSKKG